MKIALGQFAPTTDPEYNSEVIAGLVAEAAQEGAELVILPEEAMLTAEGLEMPLGEIAAREWPVFQQRIGALAGKHDIAVLANGYEESPVGLPYNTMVFFDRTGTQLDYYRKMHLYDAFAYQESRYVMRGEIKPTVVGFNGYSVGLLNCYDIRFPEHARLLVENGANVLAVSAAWVDGDLKEDHWVTLLRARAIENTCWVLATGSASEECIGVSIAIDPMGRVVTRLDREARALVYAEVSQEDVDQARYTVPVLRNRRILITQE